MRETTFLCTREGGPPVKVRAGCYEEAAIRSLSQNVLGEPIGPLGSFVSGVGVYVRKPRDAEETYVVVRMTYQLHARTPAPKA